MFTERNEEVQGGEMEQDKERGVETERLRSKCTKIKSSRKFYFMRAQQAVLKKLARVWRSKWRVSKNRFLKWRVFKNLFWRPSWKVSYSVVYNYLLVKREPLGIYLPISLS